MWRPHSVCTCERYQETAEDRFFECMLLNMESLGRLNSAPGNHRGDDWAANSRRIGTRLGQHGSRRYSMASYSGWVSTAIYHFPVCMRRSGTWTVRQTAPAALSIGDAGQVAPIRHSYYEAGAENVPGGQDG